MATPDPNDIDRVWKLMEKIGICMLASKDGEKIRSRPMGAKPRQSANVVYFLTDARGHKDDEVAQDNHVCLSFAQPSDGKFLTVSGQARVIDDRALIHELWDTAAEAWWSGPDDPVVRAIAFTPEEAEFWEGPHGIAATFAMVVAAATAGAGRAWRSTQSRSELKKTAPVFTGAAIVSVCSEDQRSGRPTRRRAGRRSRVGRSGSA